MKKKLKKPFIIAEVGNNHEGNFEVAKKMIYEVSKCGVDAVKFQTFIPELYVNTTDKKRIKQLKRFSLSKEQFFNLSIIAKKNKLKFISTPFDLESAEFLNKIVDYFKISSGNNKYYELIKKVLGFKKKTIISTGLLDLNELKKLYNFIKAHKKTRLNQISFLHCVASYPTSLKDINLERISYIKDNFNVIPGFSDHTIGLSSSIVAFLILSVPLIGINFSLSLYSTAMFGNSAFKIDNKSLIFFAFPKVMLKISFFAFSLTQQIEIPSIRSFIYVKSSLSCPSPFIFIFLF